VKRSASSAIEGQAPIKKVPVMSRNKTHFLIISLPFFSDIENPKMKKSSLKMKSNPMQ
jgi:hypothetical protein